MLTLSDAVMEVQEHVAQVQAALARLPLDAVGALVDILFEAHRRNHHVYIVGNGGSATTASHFACDLDKATIVEGCRRMRVTSLTDNVALLTAWANDTSYDRVFAEQLRNVMNTGDVLIAVSASGNSPNILAAVAAAHELGATTVGLVGFDGGALRDGVGACIHVAADDYGVVEDCHMVIQHAVARSLRQRIRG